LRGVIAAAATPITAALQPDLDRFVTLCRWLLEDGCDGLNICGTTGEATSFTVAQRMAIMSAAAHALPRERLMAGTGAAAVGDAVALTRHAAELGLAGALVLPPFYYKGVSHHGIQSYLGRIADGTATAPVPIYLYHFPAMTGIACTPELVTKLRADIGGRIAGLKDSSGDLAYARAIAATSADFDVFPSNEAVLIEARAGTFAGCISASANINASWCARAFQAGDEAALATASRIRALVSRTALIPAVKAVLAHRLADLAYRDLLPPLMRLSETEEEELLAEFGSIATGG
jgi:4-hydroxy-tetrahydrodipicolinate synthase